MRRTPLSWARYVIGLDQAIESIRNEADRRLRQEQQRGEGSRTRHKPPREGWRCPTDRVGDSRGTGRLGCQSPIRSRTGWMGDHRRGDQIFGAGEGQLVPIARSDQPGNDGHRFTHSGRSVRRARWPRKLFRCVADDASEHVEIQALRAATLLAISATAGRVLEIRSRLRAKQGRN